MIIRNQTALGALAAASILAGTPAMAQVNGIATADTAVAVASTQALQTGFQQISTQYEGQRQSLEQTQQQRQQLVQGLDTNGDGQLSEAEAAAAPQATVQQVQALDQQIAQVQAPIQRARVYVVSQLAQQYAAALQQVISDRGIQIMLAPEAIVYAPTADVTEAVTQALSARVPSVQIVPPEGWQPNQATAQLFQQIQQLLLLSAIQQQQQQQGAAGQQQQPVEGR